MLKKNKVNIVTEAFCTSLIQVPYNLASNQNNMATMYWTADKMAVLSSCSVTPFKISVIHQLTVKDAATIHLKSQTKNVTQKQT